MYPFFLKKDLKMLSDLIKIINNDDYKLLKKLLRKKSNLHIKIIIKYECEKCKHWCPFNECFRKCKHMRVYVKPCEVHQTNYKIVSKIVTEKGSKIRKKYKYRDLIYFVDKLFQTNSKKCIKLLLDSDFDFSKYHKNNIKLSRVPLYNLFRKNDIINFTKLAQKNILLNFDLIDSSYLICKMVGYHWCNKTLSCNCDKINAKYLKILFKNGLKKYIKKFYINDMMCYYDNLYYITLCDEFYTCAKLLLRTGMSVNVKNIYICKFTLLKHIMICDDSGYNSKMKRIMCFIVVNGLYSNKNNEYKYEIKKIRNKIKTAFMMAISNNKSKNSISEFFKINIGLKSYIGRKIANYIV